MKIRKFEPKDIPNLRTICHETATAKNYVDNKELVCTLYCDYYYEQEPQNILVVADDADEAQGYILCALDYKVFFENFHKLYIPKVKKLSRTEALIHQIEPLFYKNIARDYPAHLHIDLLPVCQGQGLGTKLINTLCDNLKNMGVKGISLSVGSGNVGAIKFYEKLGFEKLKSIFGKAYVYGKKLG